MEFRDCARRKSTAMAVMGLLLTLMLMFQASVARAADFWFDDLTGTAGTLPAAWSDESIDNTLSEYWCPDLKVSEQEINRLQLHSFRNTKEVIPFTSKIARSSNTSLQIHSITLPI